jgi:hypothetical protein
MYSADTPKAAVTKMVIQTSDLWRRLCIEISSVNSRLKDFHMGKSVRSPEPVMPLNQYSKDK